MLPSAANDQANSSLDCRVTCADRVASRFPSSSLLSVRREGVADPGHAPIPLQFLAGRIVQSDADRVRRSEIAPHVPNRIPAIARNREHMFRDTLIDER